MVHRIGRKTKLTAAIHAAIVNAVAVGVSVSQAARLVGIDEATVLEWIARGEGRHPRQSAPVYAGFAEAIARAQATDEAKRVARIAQAGQGGALIARKTTDKLDRQGNVVERVTEEHHTAPDWRADAFHLERSRPDRWSRRERIDVTHIIRARAQELADELGLDVDQVLAEAIAYANGKG